MSTLTIYYDAKCKHCKYLKEDFVIKKNGEKSKVWGSFCSLRDNVRISKRDKACEKFEL